MPRRSYKEYEYGLNFLAGPRSKQWSDNKNDAERFAFLHTTNENQWDSIMGNTREDHNTKIDLKSRIANNTRDSRLRGEQIAKNTKAIQKLQGGKRRAAPQKSQSFSEQNIDDLMRAT